MVGAPRSLRAREPPFRQFQPTSSRVAAGYVRLLAQVMTSPTDRGVQTGPRRRSKGCGNSPGQVAGWARLGKPQPSRAATEWPAVPSSSLTGTFRRPDASGSSAVRPRRDKHDHHAGPTSVGDLGDGASRIRRPVSGATRPLRARPLRFGPMRALRLAWSLGDAAQQRAPDQQLQLHTAEGLRTQQKANRQRWVGRPACWVSPRTFDQHPVGSCRWPTRSSCWAGVECSDSDSPANPGSETP